MRLLDVPKSVVLLRATATWIAACCLCCGFGLPASAKPPAWIVQAKLTAEILPGADLAANELPMDGAEESAAVGGAAPDAKVVAKLREALRAYVESRWQAAEQGPGKKYLVYIDDRPQAIDWLKAPRLVEPANPILVDPLQAFEMDADPAYYVNGAWRSREEAIGEAELIAEQLQQPVWLIYNSSGAEGEEATREDYMRLLAHLVFFGIPAPESLVEATLAGAGVVDVDGWGSRPLFDVAEAQWDALWYDWMKEPPTVEIEGQKQKVYPHQPNPATRQLASVLIRTTRPLTVVTHSQGGLIFRNASLIAKSASGIDWGKREVTWLSVAFPLAEEPKELLLPGLLQTQFSYAPQDPFSMALTGRGPYQFWIAPPGGGSNWGFGPLGGPWKPSPGATPTVTKVIVSKGGFSAKPAPIQVGKFWKVKNIDDQKIRVWYRYRQTSGGTSDWNIPNGQPHSSWPSQVLNPGQGMVLKTDAIYGTPAVNYVLEGEYGRWDRSYESTPRELVSFTNGKYATYYANSPAEFLEPIDLDNARADAGEKLVSVKNNTAGPIKIQIEGNPKTIDGAAGKVQSKLTDVRKGAPGDRAGVLRDSTPDEWPIRATDVTLIEIKDGKGNRYFFNKAKGTGVSEKVATTGALKTIDVREPLNNVNDDVPYFTIEIP